MQVALAVVAVLFLIAGGFVVAGVLLLAGLPWALIATGVLLFAVAAFLRSGLRPHG